MCNINKKLTLFDYAVGEFVKWDKDVTGRYDCSNNEILTSFNFTRFMKLLYFTSLASVDANSPSVHLFNTFDKFLAYKNGPVEADVYNNRNFLFNYRFNGDFLEKIEESQKEATSFENERKDFYEDNLRIYDRDKKILDNAIVQLRNLGSKFPMTNTDALIELSHDLKLWKDAVFFSYPLLDTRFFEQLKEEKECFDEKFSILNKN